MSRQERLFRGVDWHSVEQYQRQEMLREIEAVDEDSLLKASVEDLAGYFEEKFRVEVPMLLADEILVSQREKQFEASGDPSRVFMDFRRPVYVTGVEIEVEIPFTGEADAFKIQPTTSVGNSPRAQVGRARIIFRIIRTEADIESVRREIARRVEAIQANLKWLRADAAGLNSQLLAEARKAIETRRTRLLDNRNLVAALGFKIKERVDAPPTYSAPGVRRRLPPAMPHVGTAPFRPEPALLNEDYEHILSVMNNMAQVMERSPSAFAAVNEETLRFHILAQLNGHYEGQATGETFNFGGKTDILIRSEGKNIFIAECKFWGGPKKLAATLDQLLGYTSWRDTKVALIVFNRNRDFSKVLAAIPATVRAHPHYKRDLPGSTETTFRYCFANRDDRNREIFLALMAFDVPRPREQ